MVWEWRDWEGSQEREESMLVVLLVAGAVRLLLFVLEALASQGDSIRAEGREAILPDQQAYKS